MTLDEIQLAAHALGMYLADIDTPDGLEKWRAHNRAAAELRERIGFVYQPYAFPSKALMKATYDALAEHLISRADFAAVLSNVRGNFRVEGQERCA